MNTSRNRFIGWVLFWENENSPLNDGIYATFEEANAVAFKILGNHAQKDVAIHVCRAEKAYQTVGIANSYVRHEKTETQNREALRRVSDKDLY